MGLAACLGEGCWRELYLWENLENKLSFKALLQGIS